MISDRDKGVLVPAERIEKSILLIRGHKVMLDKDLAELYGVTTGNLNKAVKRNLDRFPEDFMFQLTKQESDEVLRFQNGILKRGRGQHRKYLPYAFTEQGVAMLSSVLHSDRAVQVNIAIIRVFVHLRKMLASNRELVRRLDDLERKYDTRFRVVFDAIRKLMAPSPVPSKRRIGFRQE